MVWFERILTWRKSGFMCRLHCWNVKWVRLVSGRRCVVARSEFVCVCARPCLSVTLFLACVCVTCFSFHRGEACSFVWSFVVLVLCVCVCVFLFSQLIT